MLPIIRKLLLTVQESFENPGVRALLIYPTKALARDQYDKIKQKMLAFYKSHLFIAKPPEILQFPVLDLCYCKNPTFHQLIKEILGIHEK